MISELTTDFSGMSPFNVNFSLSIGVWSGCGSHHSLDPAL
jgi:hypothetical protein